MIILPQSLWELRSAEKSFCFTCVSDKVTEPTEEHQSAVYPRLLFQSDLLILRSHTVKRKQQLNPAVAVAAATPIEGVRHPLSSEQVRRVIIYNQESLCTRTTTGDTRSVSGFTLREPKITIFLTRQLVVNYFYMSTTWWSDSSHRKNISSVQAPRTPFVLPLNWRSKDDKCLLLKLNISW